MIFRMKAIDLVRMVELANISTKVIQKTKDVVGDIVFDVKNDEIVSEFLDESMILYGRIRVKKGFKVIEEGALPIANLSQFIKFVKLFNPTDEIKIYLDNEHIVLERELPQKIVRVRRLDDKVVEEIRNRVKPFSLLRKEENVWKGEKYTWENYFTILSDKFKDVLSDLKVLGGEYRFPLQLTSEGVRFNVASEGKEYEIDRKLEVLKLVCKTSEGVKGVYGYGMDGILDVLDGKLNVWMAENDSPLLIERLDEGDGISAVYLLAPILEG